MSQIAVVPKRWYVDVSVEFVKITPTPVHELSFKIVKLAIGFAFTFTIKKLEAVSLPLIAIIFIVSFEVDVLTIDAV